MGALGFAGRCALRLGIATALALPLLAWLTDVSVDASLSVFGIDAFGAGIRLHGHLGIALLFGAAWGAGAGAAGALLAYAGGAAGRRAAPLALGDADAPGPPPHAGLPPRSGPYAPSAPYRPANPDTNPYLRLPDELREPRGGQPPERKRAPDDVYGAPTVVRPLPQPPGPRRRPPGQSVPPPRSPRPTRGSLRRPAPGGVTEPRRPPRGGAGRRLGETRATPLRHPEFPVRWTDRGGGRHWVPDTVEAP
ncbi:streptophobe family protein [Streptomyces kaempferi]